MSNRTLGRIITIAFIVWLMTMTGVFSYYAGATNVIEHSIVSYDPRGIVHINWKDCEYIHIVNN